MSIKSCFGGLLSAGVVATLVIFGCGEGDAPPATYLVKVMSVGVGATGGGEYKKGDSVTIKAGTVSEGKRFRSWTTASVGVVFADSTSATTAFRMPANDVTVTASFEAQEYTLIISNVGGTSAPYTMSCKAGETVIITAGTPPGGKRFINWTTTSQGVVFANADSATTTFTMPMRDAAVTANFADITYKVNVLTRGAGADIKTSGDGNYKPGAVITITVGKPPVGEKLKRWTTTSGGVILADSTSDTTSFIMPTNDVTLTAVFGFIDTRDRKVYEMVTIGTTRWMAENLNYKPSSVKDSSWCYDNVEANCDKYGRLYDKTLFNGTFNVYVCPPGLNFPQEYAWANLERMWGWSDTNTTGTRLKSTTGWMSGNGTDDYGFSALPGGYRHTNGHFYGITTMGKWWTRISAPATNIPHTITMKSNSEGVELEEAGIYSGTNPTPGAFSVRCYKE